MSITGYKEGIFGDAVDVLKETSRLLRLVKLDAVLRDEKHENRKPILDQIGQIWSKALETQYESLEACKRALDLEHRKLPCEVADIFLEKVENAESVDEIKKIAKKILKDSESVPLSPLKKSQRGHKGPTLLVSYPRTDLSVNFSLVAYVIKWTSREELACNLLYNAFAKQFSKNVSLGFVTPKNIGFDFTQRTFKTIDGELAVLEKDVADKLQNTFSSIARSFNSSIKLYGDKMMIAERIQGENLFDFASSKYAKLSHTQKVDLFTQIAKIIPLDMIFGNIDRLVQIWMDNKGTYQMDAYEANLGNVMITQNDQTGDPTIYAIDNGIVDNLVSDPLESQRYLAFIKSVFSMPNPEKQIAENTLKNFKATLTTWPDDMGGNVKKLRKQLKPFSADLSTIALPAFTIGIKDMLERLKHDLIPEWNSEKSASLKTHLATLQPDLLPIIEERLKTFQHSLESL